MKKPKKTMNTKARGTASAPEANVMSDNLGEPLGTGTYLHYARIPRICSYEFPTREVPCLPLNTAIPAAPTTPTRLRQAQESRPRQRLRLTAVPVPAPAPIIRSTRGNSL